MRGFVEERRGDPTSPAFRAIDDHTRLVDMQLTGGLTGAFEERIGQQMSDDEYGSTYTQSIRIAGSVRTEWEIAGESIRGAVQKTNNEMFDTLLPEKQLGESFFTADGEQAVFVRHRPEYIQAVKGRESVLNDSLGRFEELGDGSLSLGLQRVQEAFETTVDATRIRGEDNLLRHLLRDKRSQKK